MKIRKFCPHCGRPVIKSNLTKGINRYAFQCYACDEDFWHFEVYNTRKIKQVRLLQENTIRKESEQNAHFHSVYKSYPRYKI